MSREYVGLCNTVFKQHRRQIYKWTLIYTEMRLIMFIVTKDGEALYSQQKQDLELTGAQVMSSLLQNSG